MSGYVAAGYVTTLLALGGYSLWVVLRARALGHRAAGVEAGERGAEGRRWH